MKRIGILVICALLSLPLAAQKQYRNTIYQFDYDSTCWSVKGLALDVVIPGKSYVSLLDTVCMPFKVIYVQSERKTTDLETYANTQMKSNPTIANFNDKWKPSPTAHPLEDRTVMRSSTLMNDESRLLAWFFEEGDVLISVVEIVYTTSPSVSFSDAVNLIKSLRPVTQ